MTNAAAPSISGRRRNRPVAILIRSQLLIILPIRQVSMSISACLVIGGLLIALILNALFGLSLWIALLFVRVVRTTDLRLSAAAYSKSSY
ncbi:MAG: hypothetical protein M3Y24_12030 [Acidobacteriota bacterium]|nr:hypothetical protein [Acidobacteriota bacterium]